MESWSLLPVQVWGSLALNAAPFSAMNDCFLGLAACTETLTQPHLEMKFICFSL